MRRKVEEQRRQSLHSGPFFSLKTSRWLMAASCQGKTFAQLKAAHQSGRHSSSLASEVCRLQSQKHLILLLIAGGLEDNTVDLFFMDHMRCHNTPSEELSDWQQPRSQLGYSLNGAQRGVFYTESSHIQPILPMHRAPMLSHSDTLILSSCHSDSAGSNGQEEGNLQQLVPINLRSLFKCFCSATAST